MKRSYIWVVNHLPTKKTVQTFQAKTGNNEPILNFWRKFLNPPPPGIVIKMLKKLPTKETSEVHFIYPNLRDRVLVKEYDKISCLKKGVYINTNRKNLYGNG